MMVALVFGFVGGVLAGNAVPHFTRGITKQRYPNVWGGGPIPNVIAGGGADWYRRPCCCTTH